MPLESILSSPPHHLGWASLTTTLLIFFTLATVAFVVRIIDSFVSGREGPEIMLSFLMGGFTVALLGLASRRVAPSARVTILIVSAVLIEAASVLFQSEETLDCQYRVTWCGPPDHFTSSVLLSLVSHAMCFVSITSGGWRANPWTTLSVFLAWISSLFIILNIYNGDILALHENYEYTLPHYLVITAAAATDDDDLLLWMTAAVAIVANLYWVGGYPFNNIDDPADLRHRTEFYDTQCYICSSYYILLGHRILARQQRMHDADA